MTTLVGLAGGAAKGVTGAAKGAAEAVPKTVTNVLVGIYNVNWHFFIKVGVWMVILCTIAFIILEGVSYFIAASLAVPSGFACFFVQMGTLGQGQCPDPINPTLIMYDIKYILVSGIFFGVAIILLPFLYKLIIYFLESLFTWDKKVHKVAKFMLESGDKTVFSKEGVNIDTEQT